MGEPSSGQQSLEEAFRELIEAGAGPGEQLRTVIERYQAGRIAPNAGELLKAATMVPSLLVSLNEAGLSLDKMDRIVAEGDMRELNSFSAMLVYNSSNAGQGAGNFRDYYAQILNDKDNLAILSQIYQREGRTITEDEFLNGLQNTDAYIDEPYLVFGKGDIDYNSQIAGRFKDAGIAGEDFNVTQALLDHSVYAQRDNYEGPLTVISYPGGHGNDLSTFPDYSKYEPRSSFDYLVRPGDSLTSVAARLQPAIRAPDANEGARRIALLNGSADIESFSRRMQPGQTLKIPIDPAVEVIQHKVSSKENLFSLTAHYNMAGGGNTPLGLVAKFNNLSNPNLLQPGQMLNIPIRADGADLTALQKPETSDGRPTTLYITEPYDDHHFATYGTAVQYAAGVFPGYRESGLSIKPLNPSNDYDMSQTVDQLVRKGGETDSIFSISLGTPALSPQITPEGQLVDQQALDYYRHHAPKVLISAGNSFQDYREQYGVLPQIASRNTFVVGATHRDENGDSYIAPYSSAGADMTSTPLIPVDGQKMFGTSFSSPTLAAAAAQMNTWYGDRLDFEEIMYAGMLSTRIDIGDCATPKNLECASAEVGTSVFFTNGAGLPRHERAGAGEIDLNRWKENLDRLAALKKDQNLASHPVTLTVGKDDLLNEQGPDEHGAYHYDVQVPADIMMGKVVAESGPLVKMQIESPSGYQSYMGASVKHNIQTATSAFAFEDYKAGDTMRIVSSQPLAGEFRLTLYGQEPGSALSALRDTLQAEGKMLDPHSVYENGVKSQDKYAQGYFAQPELQAAGLQTAELEKPSYAPGLSSHPAF